MATQKSTAVQKALEKLEASLRAGQPYEGHEMFKTAFHRMRSRRQVEDSYALAARGAALQLAQGQATCGVELCAMLVDAYAADGAPPAENSPRLLSLLAQLPTQAASEGDDAPVDSCTKLVHSAEAWLKSVGAEDHIPEYEGALASHITRCLGWRGFGEALPHYARSGLEPFVSALGEAAARGRPDEEDLFLARAVLQTACSPGPGCSRAEALARARALLSMYPPRSAGRDPLSTPLTHFVDLLLEALSRGQDPLVRLLLQRYKPSLDRDSSLWQLVGRCREVHAPPAGAGGGPAGLPPAFGALFQQLMVRPQTSS